jgi:hypothetical protein
MPPSHEAAAGSGRSEHRNVDILIPVARQRESPAGPNVPCERRTDPAEPRRDTDPQRQPWHSATAKQVRAPGCMRRSFRTLRLCAIPGVSPRAGIRCPVEALIPSASPGTRPPQNRCEPPGACGVPSERTGCVPYPGVHPGLVCGAPLGHSERLTFRRSPTASTSPAPPAPSPQHIGSTTIVFPQRRPSNHLIEGHAPNPRSGSGIGPERA